MIKKLCTAFLCCLSLHAFGQNLTLNNGKKSKNFPYNSYYQIDFETVPAPADEPCCTYLTVYGTLSNITQDSIYVNIYSYVNNIATNEGALSDYISSPDGVFMGAYPRNKILNLTPYKSARQDRTKTSLGTIGGLLIFTGIISAANALILKDKSSKKSILISGAVQVGLGINLTLLGRRKTYSFSRARDPWRIID